MVLFVRGADSSYYTDLLLVQHYSYLYIVQCVHCISMSDFLNDLSTVVSNDLLSDLNFTDNTIDEFNHRISGDNRINDLTVFHMNIRSLNKNRSKLYNLLHSLDLTFDVIVLSEIWNCNLDLCNNLFEGYTFFRRTC